MKHPDPERVGAGAGHREHRGGTANPGSVTRETEKRRRAAALHRERGNSRSLPTESELAKTARRSANTSGAQKPRLALGMTPQRREGRRGGRGPINSPLSGERSGRGFFATLRMTRIRLAEETLPVKGRARKVGMMIGFLREQGSDEMAEDGIARRD